MRNITLIVVHCTAGAQTQSASDIVRYHTLPRRRGGLGWSTPGYHYIVEPSGFIAQVVPDWDIANGVKGHNATSIHVAYIGGVEFEIVLTYHTKEQIWTIDNKQIDIRKLTF